MEDGREDDWYEKILARSKSTMKDKRAKQNEDKRQDELFALKERMSKLRARKTPEDKAKENEMAKVGMRKTRENKTEEAQEYEKIFQKHKKRAARSRLSGKNHLLQNLAAKKGMVKFKENGRLIDFQRRSTSNTTEMHDLKNVLCLTNLT